MELIVLLCSDLVQLFAQGQVLSLKLGNDLPQPRARIVCVLWRRLLKEAPLDVFGFVICFGDDLATVPSLLGERISVKLMSEPPFYLRNHIFPGDCDVGVRKLFDHQRDPPREVLR
ncbi:hypothetical protein VCH24_34710 [Variovorax boronicumulans]|nr:hypothetical protein VCH24_34710 [Variovorax boronicumulans]